MPQSTILPHAACLIYGKIWQLWDGLEIGRLDIACKTILVTHHLQVMMVMVMVMVKYVPAVMDAAANMDGTIDPDRCWTLESERQMPLRDPDHVCVCVCVSVCVCVCVCHQCTKDMRNY